MSVDIESRFGTLLRMAQVQNIAKVIRADAASGIRRILPRTWTKAAGILSTRKSKKSLVTIIDDENLRGLVAPASLISREMLGDIVDLIEYSDSKVVTRVNRGFKSKKLVNGRTLRKDLGV